MAAASNTIIESIGVYLPPSAVSTAELLRGCRQEIRFPLEQFTGIASRRMAGESEFAIHLAANAVGQCLKMSSHAPQDVDLLICAHIAHYDAPNRVTYEPGAAVTIKKQFGLDNALAFDLNNACAGMFTALYLVDGLIRAGLVRCGMVVSGEYITHLTKTAQEEITGFMDPQLACLTLGDAGAAVILEPSPDRRVGFQAFDLLTLGKYSSLCIAKPSAGEHGGAAMATDSIRATAAVVEHTAKHAAHVVRGSGRFVEDFQHIIPHQTSSTSIKEGLREIARQFNKNLESVVVDNVAQRGNSASNTHWVAVRDQILKGRIHSGDSAIFCFSGSGITVGTALYTFDNLPDRLRQVESNHRPPAPTPSPASSRLARWPMQPPPRIGIEAVGTSTPAPGGPAAETRELIRAAAGNCLAGSSHRLEEVGLLISTGLYRTDFIGEPAIAAIAAGDLKLNLDSEPADRCRTLTFDLLNGAIGFLNACCVACGMIKAERFETVMVVASEIENNADLPPAKQRRVRPMGSAVILDRSADGRTGFTGFYFRDFTEHLDLFSAYAAHQHGATRIVLRRSSQLEARFRECIVATVRELLDREGLEISQFGSVFPPQISTQFVEDLAPALGVARDRMVDVSHPEHDLFTSSTPRAMEHASARGIVAPGDLGLIIEVASGIQVGCAIYQF